MPILYPKRLNSSASASLANDPQLCCRSHPHEQQSPHCQLREVSDWLRFCLTVGRMSDPEHMLRYAEQIDQVALGLLEPVPTAPAEPTWKDHQTVQLVNRIRACAIQYHGTEQLRAQLAEVVAPLCERLKASPAGEQSAPPHWFAYSLHCASEVDKANQERDAALASLKRHEAFAERSLAQEEQAQAFADKVLDLVLGIDRAEWSSAYGFAQALADVEEAMAMTRKPSQPSGPVDRANLESRWLPFWIGVDLAAGPDQTVYHQPQAHPIQEDTGPLETSEDMAIEPEAPQPQPESKTTMTRVYLSGPMTGIPDNNFHSFNQWAAQLRAQGYDVVSPAEIQEASTWELCLRADLRELCTCDAIALMPGWENSKGANLELHVAHRLGMQVMHLPLQFDLVSHLHRQISFSERTFGPGERTQGVVDHIRKELVEVLDGDGDLEEWVDVIILAFDGAWRSGHTPEQIVAAIVAKQTKNEGRRWPDWRTAEPGKAIEHVRETSS